MRFNREFRLKQHMKSHDIKVFECDICKKTFNRHDNLNQHKKTHSVNTPSKCKNPLTMRDVFSTHTITPTDITAGDLSLFLEEARPKIFDVLKEKIELYTGVKWYIIVKVCLSREDFVGDSEFIHPFFRSCVATEINSSEISHNIDVAFTKVSNTFEEFMELGSNFELEYIEHLEVKMATYKPLTR